MLSNGKWEVVRPHDRDPTRHSWQGATCSRPGQYFDVLVLLAPVDTDQWVIWSDGGGFCDDNAVPCEKRASVNVNDLGTALGLQDDTLVKKPSLVSNAGLFSRAGSSTACPRRWSVDWCCLSANLSPACPPARRWTSGR